MATPTFLGAKYATPTTMTEEDTTQVFDTLNLRRKVVKGAVSRRRYIVALQTMHMDSGFQTRLLAHLRQYGIHTSFDFMVPQDNMAAYAHSNLTMNRASVGTTAGTLDISVLEDTDASLDGAYFTLNRVPNTIYRYKHVSNKVFNMPSIPVRKGDIVNFNPVIKVFHADNTSKSVTFNRGVMTTYLLNVIEDLDSGIGWAD